MQALVSNSARLLSLSHHHSHRHHLPHYLSYQQQQEEQHHKASKPVCHFCGGVKKHVGLSKRSYIINNAYTSMLTLKKKRRSWWRCCCESGGAKAAAKIRQEGAGGEAHYQSPPPCDDRVVDHPAFLSNTSISGNKTSTAAATTSTAIHPTGRAQNENDVIWGLESTFATMVTYYGVLHVPLSICGLSLVRGIFHLDTVEPETKAISLVLLQLIELFAAVGLIESTVKPYSRPPIWFSFNVHDLLKEKRSILASIKGLLALFIVMGSVSAFSQNFLHGQQDAENSHYLQEMLSSSTLSIACTFLVSCIITPILEEYMYRGFLLTSFSASMPQHSAIIISAVLFSMAHFSLPNSIYFCIIGYILGHIACSTKNLVPSLLVHSGYNFVVLMSVMLQR